MRRQNEWHRGDAASQPVSPGAGVPYPTQTKLFPRKRGSGLPTAAPPDSSEKLLLCRPIVKGNATQARPESIQQAAKKLEGRLLDRKSPCKDSAEAAMAAHLFRLRRAILTTAEGSSEGSTYSLTLIDAEKDGLQLDSRLVKVAPNLDAAPVVEQALGELIGRRAVVAQASPGTGMLAAGRQPEPDDKPESEQSKNNRRLLYLGAGGLAAGTLGYVINPHHLYMPGSFKERTGSIMVAVGVGAVVTSLAYLVFNNYLLD